MRVAEPVDEAKDAAAEKDEGKFALREGSERGR